MAPGVVHDHVVPRHLDVDDLGPGHEVSGHLADPGQRALLLQRVPPRPLVGQVAAGAGVANINNMRPPMEGNKNLGTAS